MEPQILWIGGKVMGYDIGCEFITISSPEDTFFGFGMGLKPPLISPAVVHLEAVVTVIEYYLKHKKLEQAHYVLLKGHDPILDKIFIMRDYFSELDTQGAVSKSSDYNYGQINTIMSLVFEYHAVFKLESNKALPSQWKKLIGDWFSSYQGLKERKKLPADRGKVLEQFYTLILALALGLIEGRITVQF